MISIIISLFASKLTADPKIILIKYQNPPTLAKKLKIDNKICRGEVSSFTLSIVAWDSDWEVTWVVVVVSSILVEVGW